MCYTLRHLWRNNTCVRHVVSVRQVNPPGARRGQHPIVCSNHTMPYCSIAYVNNTILHAMLCYVTSRECMVTWHKVMNRVRRGHRPLCLILSLLLLLLLLLLSTTTNNKYNTSNSSNSTNNSTNDDNDEYSDDTPLLIKLGEHKPGRIKLGLIKRAALSLQNQNHYYIYIYIYIYMYVYIYIYIYTCLLSF